METGKQKTMITKGMLLEVKKENDVIKGVVIDLYKHKSWLQLTILDSEGTIYKCSYSLWDGSFHWQDNTINVLAAMAFIKESKQEKEDK
jgi:hypothetical protein